MRPPSGGQYGPATGEVLRQWISEGRVAATSLLWREGWPQWREAKDALPELAGRLPEPAGSDNKMVSANQATPREADEFGLGDQLDTTLLETTRRQEVVNSNSSMNSFSGRADAGSERRNRSDRRTLTIVGLTSVAICLVFALAFVLSR